MISLCYKRENRRGSTVFVWLHCCVTSNLKLRRENLRWIRFATVWSDATTCSLSLSIVSKAPAEPLSIFIETMELRVKQKSSFTRKLKLEQRKEGKQQRQGLASEKLWGETNPLIVSLSSIQSRACITQKVMSSRLSLTHGKRKTLKESSDSLKMLPRANRRGGG